MAFSSGKSSCTDQDILDLVSEPVLAAKFLGITRTKCSIPSPHRKDKHPSFCIFPTPDGRLLCKDHGDPSMGSLTVLDYICSYVLRVSKQKFLEQEVPKIIGENKTYNVKLDKANILGKNSKKIEGTKMEVTIRKWEQKDKDYWASYGVPFHFISHAGVAPISYIHFTKEEGVTYSFPADPYAYVFVECKEGEYSIKVYQPFSSNNKWKNKHDGSVISLWTLLPETGDKVCICSSLKDALCLYANTGIPAVCTQGEGYPISKTAQKELKRRFKRVYIMLDNDEAGILYANKLAEETGFKNIRLPKIEFPKAKDISDVYHEWRDKERFRNFILPLFK